VEHVHGRVANAPLATATLGRLLRLTEQVDVRDGLYAESAAYSVLLAGPERAALLAARRPVDDSGNRLRIERVGELLTVTLCRPDRRNCVDSRLRDELCDALQIALCDPAVRVRLLADGEDWSTGGDLNEFGSLPDPATAHIVRQVRSVGWALAALGERVTCHVHGRCIGSGIELPAFAAWLSAAPDLRVSLPELGLGLVPGAGGTVSIVRRIGRWRTLWMLLSGAVVDAPRALEWGLVDEIVA
jgi:enoyl-CoA hydratase/carnithine racemase